MHQLTTEIDLQTTRDRVWELLSDFTLYPQWNPLLIEVKGSGSAGGEHELRVHLPGMEPFTVRARLFRFGDAEVAWESIYGGRLLLTWTFSCRIEPLAPERLRFQVISRFSGLLAPLFRLALDRPLVPGMEQLNQAVRRWGEKGNMRCLRC